MSRPKDMAAVVWDRIAKLPSDTRDRVLERAAILIFEAGLSPHVADERALAEEARIFTQQTIGGAL
jgi:hypothetical protein